MQEVSQGGVITKIEGTSFKTTGTPLKLFFSPRAHNTKGFMVLEHETSEGEIERKTLTPDQAKVMVKLIQDWLASIHA